MKRKRKPAKAEPFRRRRDERDRKDPSRREKNRLNRFINEEQE